MRPDPALHRDNPQGRGETNAQLPGPRMSKDVSASGVFPAARLLGAAFPSRMTIAEEITPLSRG